MILSLMIYVLVVTTLSAAAAWALEHALGERGLPTRWVWAVAMAGAVVAAVVALPKQHVTVTIDTDAAAFSIEATEPSAPISPTAAARATDAAADGRFGVPDSFDPLLTGLWFALSLVMLGGLARSWFALERERREWQPANLDGYGVLLSERRGPAVVGVTHPEIVVPGWLPRLPASDRSLLLEHEREHVVSGDSRLLAAAWALLALMPWNAPLWWIGVRLRQALEIDCDRRVLRDSPGIRRYASLLIDVGERTRLPRFAVLTFASPALFLERRIRAMTHPNNPGRFRAMLFALLGALFIAGACYVEQLEVHLGDESVEAADAATTAREVFEAAELLAAEGVSVRPGDEKPPFTVSVEYVGNRLIGTVRDRATHEPVGDALALLADLKRGDVTDAYGRFSLANPPVGEHELRVTKPAEYPGAYSAQILVPDDSWLRARYERLRESYIALQNRVILGETREVEHILDPQPVPPRETEAHLDDLMRERLAEDARGSSRDLLKRVIEETRGEVPELTRRVRELRRDRSGLGHPTTPFGTARNGSITGRVTDADGNGLQSAQVTVAMSPTRDGARTPAMPSRVQRADTAMQLPEGSFTGVVTDMDDSPIVGAQVFFPNLNMGGLTNDRGRFLILNVPAADHTFRVEAVGFEPREVTLSFGGRAVTLTTLKMRAIGGG